MKYKVFFLAILGVFVLWGTPKFAESMLKITSTDCIFGGGEIFQDVATGKWLCCTDPEDVNKDGDIECDTEVVVGGTDGIDILGVEPPKKEGPRGLKPHPMTEQPPEKRDPNVLTPRPLTKQPRKGTTRQPAQEVR